MPLSELQLACLSVAGFFGLLLVTSIARGAFFGNKYVLLLSVTYLDWKYSIAEKLKLSREEFIANCAAFNADDLTGAGDASSVALPLRGLSRLLHVFNILTY